MKTRVFSAVLMIIVFIPFLLLGGIPFAIFMAFLSAYALHEVIKVRETRKKFPTVLKLFAYILVLVLCFTDLNTIEFQYNMDYRFLAFIVFLYSFDESNAFIKFSSSVVTSNPFPFAK